MQYISFALKTNKAKIHMEIVEGQQLPIPNDTGRWFEGQVTPLQLICSVSFFICKRKVSNFAISIMLRKSNGTANVTLLSHNLDSKGNTCMKKFQIVKYFNKIDLESDVKYIFYMNIIILYSYLSYERKVK